MIDTNIAEARPTWRKPVGILLLVVALAVYAGGVARAAEWIGTWPVIAQTLAYCVLGTIWLLPLRRFLIWMETGRWG